METKDYDEITLSQRDLEDIKDSSFNEGVEAAYDLLRNSVEGTVKIGWDEMKVMKEGIFSDIRDLFR